MKRILLCILACIICIATYSQESAKPTFDVKITRDVAIAIIEDIKYYNVEIKLNAAPFDDLFLEGVKVTVKDKKTGKKIYKKRFSSSYLYGFADGTIQVGKGNAIRQVILIQSKEDRTKWFCEIKKGGLY